MPNIKSSIRSVKTDAERNLRNAAMKSQIKTYSKKFEQTVKTGTKDEAISLLSKAVSCIDKAANKGVIHKNAAARKKSQLADKLNGIANA